MIRLSLVLAAAVLLGDGVQQQGIVWMRLEQARVVAAKTGRGMAVLVACDPKSGNVACGRASGTDKAFGDASMDRWREKLLFARVTDKKTAEGLRAECCLEILFLASDGEEIHRSAFKDLEALGRDCALAVKRTTPRAPEWASIDGKLPAKAVGSDRPLVVFFVDDRKESQDTIKALEDRELAALHDRVTFIRIAWKKDTEDSKRWGASQAPTVVVVDPDSHEAIERAAGRKSGRELKALIQKALAKAEKPERK